MLLRVLNDNWLEPIWFASLGLCSSRGLISPVLKKSLLCESFDAANLDVDGYLATGWSEAIGYKWFTEFSALSGFEVSVALYMFFIVSRRSTGSFGTEAFLLEF